MSFSYDIFIAAQPDDALAAVASLLARAGFAVLAVPGRALKARRFECQPVDDGPVSLDLDVRMLNGPGGSAVARILCTPPSHDSPDGEIGQLLEQRFRAHVAALSGALMRAGNRNSTTLM